MEKVIRKMYKNIHKCRICNSANLVNIVSLGEQCLTGIFPKMEDLKVTKGPLDLLWCANCSLVQLKQSYSLDEMYGDNYGYRSGLNVTMVRHLEKKVNFLNQFRPLYSGDLVLDIGSNDGTTLKAYKNDNIVRVGVDPTGRMFRKYYSDDVDVISEFFPSGTYNKKYSNKKAKIVTSIAMFYDLEDPHDFVEEIVSILDTDGIWHFEQSYMPSMLRMTAYDTVCHEHLEYYSLGAVKSLLEDCGLKILDVQINDINGGSFAITAGHKNTKAFHENKPVIEWLLLQEERMGLNTPRPYRDFEERVFRHRSDLWDLVTAIRDDGKTIIGYGASTKGNVLLQFCGFSGNEIPFIAEINEHKFGCVTPGTGIPIISDEEARSINPDYFFVLPWHFKGSILDREQEFIAKGGKFIFPLPYIEIS